MFTLQIECISIEFFLESILDFIIFWCVHHFLFILYFESLIIFLNERTRNIFTLYTQKKNGMNMMDKNLYTWRLGRGVLFKIVSRFKCKIFNMKLKKKLFILNTMQYFKFKLTKYNWILNTCVYNISSIPRRGGFETFWVRN